MVKATTTEQESDEDENESREEASRMADECSPVRSTVSMVSRLSYMDNHHLGEALTNRTNEFRRLEVCIQNTGRSKKKVLCNRYAEFGIPLNSKSYTMNSLALNFANELNFDRPQLHRGLLEDDFDRRIEFYEWFVRCTAYNYLQNHIIWTDEAFFKLNDSVIDITTMWSSDVVYPYFFSGTVSRDSYLKVLQEAVLHELSYVHWIAAAQSPDLPVALVIPRRGRLVSCLCGSRPGIDQVMRDAAYATRAALSRRPNQRLGPAGSRAHSTLRHGPHIFSVQCCGPGIPTHRH
ncbi:hypothetical protein J6590_020066 [Homalodisca vitripennis]|nr:hypothetical protein J6590_020066 [Homalodisca vitripennis]